MKKRLQILLLIMGMALLGCEKKENEQFFTFGEVGNSWTFKHTREDYHIPPTEHIDTITYSITDYEGNNIYKLSNGDRWYISDTEFGLVNNYNGSLYIYVNKYSIYYNNEHTSVSSTDNYIVVCGDDSLNCYNWSYSYTSFSNYSISRRYGIVRYGFTNSMMIGEDWELIDKNF
jgi:hypothetical protein